MIHTTRVIKQDKVDISNRVNCNIEESPDSLELILSGSVDANILMKLIWDKGYTLFSLQYFDTISEISKEYKQGGLDCSDGSMKSFDQNNAMRAYDKILEVLRSFDYSLQLHPTGDADIIWNGQPPVDNWKMKYESTRLYVPKVKVVKVTKPILIGLPENKPSGRI